MSTAKAPRFVVILMSSWVLGLAAVSFYTPAMAMIGKSLGVSPVLVKLTITYFLLGKAISMFIYGPFVEAFGRKRYLTGGLTIFTIGSIICAASSSIHIIILGRILQGFGVSLCILMGRAIINDRFVHRKAANLFSYIFIGNAVAITLLPILSGYVATYIGWRAIFIIMAVYGAVIVASTQFFLPETNPNATLKSIQPRQIIQNYYHILSNRQFWGFMLVLALMTAGEKAFTTSAAYIYIDALHYSKVMFGYLTGTLWLAHLLGVLICGVLVLRFDIDAMMAVGVGLLVLAAMVMGLGVIIGVASGVLLALAMLLYMLGSGFVVTTAAVGVIRPFPKLIGLSTAIAMAIEFLLAFGVSYLVSHFTVHAIKPVLIVIATLAITALIAWWVLVRPAWLKQKTVA